MKNLVIVCAGEESLHENWTAGPDESLFDLAVIYYGERENRYRERADFYLMQKGLKWRLLHSFLGTMAGEMDSYDYVWFPDDDLMADTSSINRLFEIMAEYELDLAQPSLAPESYINHRITRRRSSFLRYTNFVEVMAPAFSLPALKKCSPMFAEAVTGWGMDVIWPHKVNPTFEKDNVAIIDAVSVTHTRPLNLSGGFYGSLGKSPHEEMNALLKRYGLKLRPIAYKYRPRNAPSQIKRMLGYYRMLLAGRRGASY